MPPVGYTVLSLVIKYIKCIAVRPRLKAMIVYSPQATFGVRMKMVL